MAKWVASRGDSRPDLEPGFALRGRSSGGARLEVGARESAGDDRHRHVVAPEKGLPILSELTRVRDLSYVDLPSVHWPQFTKPQELGDAILRDL